ncbi:hypothetical protein LOZ53_002578 [Ophidiomyces ophidiicola]|nr:hypothetical protein LOZ55_000699 [Ophidiomyces ophidiicola]KAI1992262.1 hypothetical protein LOZ53_002578 [Ophidiomyces ophidiicola]KAI1993235.1 hypothetical protein LOZ54_001437 [Ophidiomyces ophidiicola]KAI1998610.1 hypothetical protein LOZ51_002344 [Ophidiomyces ophidiicola]
MAANLWLLQQAGKVDELRNALRLGVMALPVAVDDTTVDASDSRGDHTTGQQNGYKWRRVNEGDNGCAPKVWRRQVERQRIEHESGDANELNILNVSVTTECGRLACDLNHQPVHLGPPPSILSCSGGEFVAADNARVNSRLDAQSMSPARQFRCAGRLARCYHPKLPQCPIRKLGAKSQDKVSVKSLKEYNAGLKEQLTQLQKKGVQATIEVQAAARKVAEENRHLKELCLHVGLSLQTIEAWLKARRQLQTKRLDLPQQRHNTNVPRSGSYQMNENVNPSAQRNIDLNLGDSASTLPEPHSGQLHHKGGTLYLDNQD